MKRKAEVKSSKVEETKVPAHMEGAQSTIRIGLPYLVFSLLVVLLLTILQYQLVVAGPSAKKNQIFVDTALRSYVESILVKLEASQDYLEEYSKQRDLVTAVAQRDMAAIAEFERSVAEKIPYSLGVKVVFSDALEQDTSSKPAITYAVLELVREMTKGTTVHPEVISPGSADQYVAIFAPIKSGDQVIAVSMLGLDRQLIDDVVKRIHVVPGYVEVWQNFYQNNQIVGTGSSVSSEGNVAFKEGDPFYVGSVNNSNWQVAFWPADVAEFSGQAELTYFLIGVILAIATVAGMNYYGLRKLQAQVKADTGELVKLLIDADTPMKHSAHRFVIDYFRDLTMTLARNGFDPSSLGKVDASKPAGVNKAAPRATVKDTSLSRTLAEDDSLIVETVASSSVKLPESIFRAYDIRGVVDTHLTPEVVYELGRAIGSEAFNRGEQKIVVARDGRLSGPSLMQSLKDGLTASGRDVIDIGEVPTPILYFATNYLDTNSGVMLTGSHNPANYNGLKIVIAGDTLSQDGIQALRTRIMNDDLVSGQGSVEERDIVADYIGQITADVALAQPLKVAVDCGNGVAGSMVPRLLQALGCEVIGLYCDVDGNFPNHHPDPSKPENLKDLINMVRSEQADVGLAFDGDGDRLGVIASDGTIIWPDRQMMLYAIDVLSRNPGADIIFDVKCTRHLPKVISSHGGRPIMWKTGHSFVKAKMRETGSILAGECSGHIFFKERWFGFDDALYTAARLLEILAGDVRKSEEVFAALPNSNATPEININISDTRKFDFVDKLVKHGEFGDGKVTTIDGLRVDFDEGWGLVRASNTTPCLVLRFEADDDSAMHRIQDLFRQQMMLIDNSLQLPF